MSKYEFKEKNDLLTSFFANKLLASERGFVSEQTGIPLGTLQAISERRLYVRGKVLEKLCSYFGIALYAICNGDAEVIYSTKRVFKEHKDCVVRNEDGKYLFLGKPTRKAIHREISFFEDVEKASVFPNARDAARAIRIAKRRFKEVNCKVENLG